MISKKIRLTPAQKMFLKDIFCANQNEERSAYWCCPGYERRFALSLRKKGLVEFQDDKPVNDLSLFYARITNKCYKLIDEGEIIIG